MHLLQCDMEVATIVERGFGANGIVILFCPRIETCFSFLSSPLFWFLFLLVGEDLNPSVPSFAHVFR